MNDPSVDWNPITNEVRPAPAETIEGGARPRAAVPAAREPDARYAKILANFRAVKAADPYSPSAPTHIARKFELEREIPEARVVAMLEEVLGAPEIARIAKVIEERLGRALEPFDIWYAGFKPRVERSEADLDRLTRSRYPTAAAFAKELPATLQRLGFSEEKARFLTARIAVDPARGSGHALEAARRGDQAHLRTRVGPSGMDYKGFNIAIHELGHNVEQVFSLYGVDHTLLRGVPNTAFTEAIAFVFQARDLEVLGLPPPSADARRLLALNDLWATFEIAGVALVDIGVWHWMYDHPRATPAQLREATLGIAREVWNRWYAPVFGARDVPLLADLLAPGLEPALPARLSHRPSHRGAARGAPRAPAAGHAARRGDRADHGAGRARARRLDEGSDGRARLGAAAHPRGRAGARPQLGDLGADRARAT